MAEDDFRRIARFQRHPRRVVENGQSVRDERMAQAILLPLNTLAELCRRDLRALMHANRPDGLLAWCQPELEVVGDRHQTALPGFGLAGIDRDKATIQIDVLPVQSLQFGHPKARERSESEERAQGVV